MPLESVTRTVDEPLVGRIDLVVREMAQTSRAQVRGMFDHGCVWINEQPCTDPGVPVSLGDVVLLKFDPHTRYREKKKRWDDRVFSIAYEDDDIIVVDKAAGSLTVPTDHHEPNTLVQRVSVYLSHSRRSRDACVVHRLDREVSGLLVFGKSEEVAENLIEQFKRRKPTRVYAAIVAGVIERDSGTYESHLATGKNLDRYVTSPGKHSERAITHFEVVRRMSDTTLVTAKLETGKRNQIRVHFAHAGHPVLGDPRYQPDAASHPRWVRKRIALHAKTLGFSHPTTNKPMSFESELPSAMTKFIAGGR